MCGTCMQGKKNKSELQTATWISLMVALILISIDALRWAISFIITIFMKNNDMGNSDLGKIVAYSIPFLVAVLLLLIMIYIVDGMNSSSK